MNNSIIIDASVVAKWLLPDEENPVANLIKKDFAKGMLVSVPIFIFYEVNNLLKSAVSSGRLKTNTALSLYEAFLELNFTVYSSKRFLKSTLKKALDLDISSYDASYVVLAESLQIPFYNCKKTPFS